MVVNQKTYFIANIETFSAEWQEPGPPMRLVLKPAEATEEEELSDAQLLAISQQKDQFIAVYPNPFVNELLIAYTLPEAAQVSVEVFDFTGNPVQVPFAKAES